MAKCFLITGGGTGAKVAEAMVHLCAGGAGPRELHVLVIDADTDNGNVSRTRDTIESYQRLRPWGWHLQPASGTPIDYFATKITAYYLTEQIADVISGSLFEAIRGHCEMGDVLDLFYDKDEQDSRHTYGFHARANLGCAILAEYLERCFQAGHANPQPLAFIRELRDTVRANEPAKVVVAGSVFGGTGASLLPIARQCILTALNPNPQEAKHLEFAAIIMLPYFSIRERLGPVDPKRFLLDTSLALQYYGLTGFTQKNSYNTFYLIGSDNPARQSYHLPQTVNGGSQQVNPPFFEEVLGALGAIDFAQRGAGGGEPVRIYERGGPTTEVTWETLPLGGSPDAGHAVSQLVWFLHVAAFYLRPSTEGSGELSGGLHDLLSDISGTDLEFFGWFQTLLHEWALEHASYKQVNGRNEDLWATLREKMHSRENAGVHLQPILREYFLRVLGWAFSALREDGLKLYDLPQGAERRQDYARLYSMMCDILPEEINQEGLELPYAKDNAYARLVRASVVAMERLGREKFLTRNAKPLGEPIALRRSDAQGKRHAVPLIDAEALKTAADELGRRNVLDSYTRA